MLRRYNSLDAADRQAFGKIVQAGGDDAVEGAAKLDTDGLQSLIDADLPAATKARGMRRVTAGDLDSASIQRMDDLLDAGEMDSVDVDRMLGILESKNRDSAFTEEIASDDLLRIVSEGDLSDTRLVAKDGNDRTRWLEFNEGELVGFDKILNRHESQFYGQYESVRSRDGIKQVIKEAIEKSDTDSVVIQPNPGGGKRYIYNVEDGSYPLRVSTADNGFILSAHPDQDTVDLFS